MGQLLVIAAAVASTVATVVAAIAAFVASIVAFIATAIWAAIGAVASVVAGSVAGILHGLGLVSYYSIAEVLTTVGLMNTISMTVTLSLSHWIATAVTVFAAFAEAIHLAAILKIHQIAMVVSKDYRLMMNKIYAQIAEVSTAIGQSAQFMNLAFRNARAIVLDASTSLGKRYDLAEISWLYNFNDIMKVVQEKAEVYEHTPQELFNDLDRIIIRPAMNAKAEATLMVFTQIEGLLNRTKEVVENLGIMREKIQRLLHDLPSFIQDRIAPEINKVLHVFDEFVADVYQPTVGQLDEIVGILNTNRQRQTTDIEGILERMKKPGDMMLSIDDLEDMDRIDQEIKIGEVATRAIRQATEELTAQSQSAMHGLMKVRAALKRPIELAAWHVKEVLAPIERPIEEIDSLGTWFVGEY